MSERPGPSPEELGSPEQAEKDKLYDESLRALTVIVGKHPDAEIVRDEFEGAEYVYRKLSLENVAGLSKVEFVHWGEGTVPGDWIATLHLPDHETHHAENPTERETYDWYPNEKEIRGDSETEEIPIEDQRFVATKLSEIRSELEQRGEI